ncbi:MAG TPA: DegV family protein [Syntrophorhabdaceae bacterium]|nr:DegV family protein [Syntrophorhabdaceae bacterium]
MRIVTDSTADLTKELYDELDIEMVPLTIQLGERRWRDYLDVKPDEYYALLRTSTDFPTTSQPSPQDFIDVYRPIVEKNEPILSIHISSALSGTYQSACLAKSYFPQARIEVVDSRQASLGLALILHLCAANVRSGHSFEAVVEQAVRLSKTVETYFSVDSLSYLQRGGRIGRAQAFLGTLMKIKPILKVVEGEVHPIEKIRTTERLIDRYVRLVEMKAAEGLPVSVVVAGSDNTHIVTALAERLVQIPNVHVVQHCKIGGVVASHTGPGVLGIAFVHDDN